MPKKSPCRYCCDRKVGCHGVCKDYMEWANEHSKQREQIHKQQKIVSEIEQLNKQVANKKRSSNISLKCHKV